MIKPARINPSQNYLLFDGECGICSASARLAERLDRRQQFLVFPYQYFAEEELLHWNTSSEKCARRVHVLSAHGKVYTGAFAVNYFLWQYFPWKLLVALFYVVPVFLLLEILGYALVARHRRRLSQWLGFTACAIAPQKPQT